MSSNPSHPNSLNAFDITSAAVYDLPFEPPKHPHFGRSKRVKAKPKIATNSTPNGQLLFGATTSAETEQFLNRDSFKITTKMAYPLPPTLVKCPDTTDQQSSVVAPVCAVRFEDNPHDIEPLTCAAVRIDEFTSHPSNEHTLIEIEIPDTGETRLVDTGSHMTIMPHNAAIDKPEELPFRLIAVNESPLSTYGYRHDTFCINGLKLSWNYITADVPKAIIGIDFLRTHQLTIDPVKNQLIHQPTGTVIQCRPARETSKCYRVQYDNPAVELLQKFPELTDDVRREAKENRTRHYIHTVGQPKPAPTYQYSPKIENLLTAHFTDLLDKKYCERSNSPISSPIVVIAKQDGSIRACGDYRALNEQTINDSYNLPHIYSFTNFLAGKRYFSIIDFDKAFYQIRVYEGHVWKTAVRTPIGLLQFRFMPFGLKCAAQTWQRFADEMFEDFRHFVFIYIDDLLIHSYTLEEHLKHLELVFARMKEFAVKINSKKSQLCQQEVRYLGFHVNEKGIGPTDDKVSALLSLPEPKTIKQLRKFLCAFGYYHRFVPNFFKTARSLLAIRPKTKNTASEPVELNDVQRADFTKLRQMLADRVRLAHPVANATLILEVDASGTGQGAVLYQMVAQQLEPLYFYSKAFNDKQLHWDAYRKELEALYQVIVRLNRYILGNELVVYTDNTSLLRNLKSSRDIVNPVELRKLLTISERISEVQYVPTNRNQVADYLSRITTIKQYAINLAVYLGSAIDYALLSAHQAEDEWCRSLKPGRQFRRVFKTFKGRSMPFWVRIEDNGDQRFCVPARSVRQVFNAYHTLHHPGHNRTRRLIATRFYWPKIHDQVQFLTRACIDCQKNKFHRLQRQPIKRNPLESEKLGHLHIDSMGPMPDELVGEEGYRYILTIRDQATRYLVLAPLKTLEKEETLEVFVARWIGNFGLPKTVTTDNGGQFCNHLLDYLLERLGIQHHRTLPHLPRANGLIERPHSQIAASIRCLPAKNNWASSLPILQLAWNNTVFDGSQHTPFQLTFGKPGRLPSDFFEPPVNAQPTDPQMARDLFDAMIQFRPAPLTNKGTIKKPFLHKNILQAEQVWLRDFGRRNKFVPVYRGPYRVIERSPTHFLIETAPGQQTRQSLDYLKPAYQDNVTFVHPYQCKPQCKSFAH